jgi:hypothetical protein
MNKVRDLMGQRLNKWTVIKRIYPNSKSREVRWLCKCECGNERILVGSSLTRKNNTKSIKNCGCLRNGRKDIMIGKRFGKLTIIKKTDYHKYRQSIYLCKCDCGKETTVSANNLRKGNTKSCGCLRRKLSQKIVSIRRKIRQYKRDAKMREYNFDLTDEQFTEIIEKDCHYCGKKPKNNGIYIYNGIDRVNNNKGYSIDNVVPCCTECNCKKGILTLQEFQNWIERVYNKLTLARQVV